MRERKFGAVASIDGHRVGAIPRIGFVDGIALEVLERASRRWRHSDPFARLFLADKKIVLGGFGLAVMGDGCNRVIGRFRGQASEARTVLVLLKIYFFS